MSFEPPGSLGITDPLLGFRFVVVFLGKLGIDHPLDFRFQSVSGLSTEVKVDRIGGAGMNVRSYNYPKAINYSNLILKRGKPKVSTLSIEFQKSLYRFQFKPRTVLLSVLNQDAIPINNWLFSDAYPVKWSLSGLDANQNDVLIEEMELSYSTFKPFYL